MKRSAFLILATILSLITPIAAEASDLWSSDRLDHAKELLGKYYRRSVAALEQSEADSDEFREFITERVQAKLKGAWKKKAAKIGQAIVKESKMHGFDPIFLMAVIENESSFNPTARGTSGELGLMQVMPKTARWTAKKYGIPFAGKKTLLDPVANIRIGAAYLAYLRAEFDFHGRLYLSAYNMGSTNVRNSLDRRVWPKEYAARVMQRYMRLYTELRDVLREHPQNS